MILLIGVKVIRLGSYYEKGRSSRTVKKLHVILLVEMRLKAARSSHPGSALQLISHVFALMLPKGVVSFEDLAASFLAACVCLLVEPML